MAQMDKLVNSRNPRALRSPGSPVKWRSWTHAELVAFRIGHRDEACVRRLSDIDATRTQRLEFAGLGLHIIHPEIEVHAGLRGLRFRHPLEDHRWVGPLVWNEQSVVVLDADLAVLE